MHRKEFDSSFVGFTEDGAKWVVDNTDIKLVGNTLICCIFLGVIRLSYKIIKFLTILKANGCACTDFPDYECRN